MKPGLLELESVRGLGWPSPAQRLLLSVLLAPAERARAAWLHWRSSNRLDALDVGSLRLLPLCIQRFEELALEDTELSRLWGVARHTWASNQSRVRSGLEVAQALAGAQITVCALKGLALLDRYYGGDFAARPMYDVDLLVQPERAGDSAALLLSLGFDATPPISPRALTARGLRWGVAHAFRRGYASIDLHWHVLHQDSSRFFDGVAWANATPLAAAAGSGVIELAPTEHLIHICLHGVRYDASTNRVWPLDAVRILEDAGTVIDWQRLLRIAVTRRLTIPLFDALSFLATLSGSVPEFALDRLAAEPVCSLELLEYRAITSAWRELSDPVRAALGQMAELRRRFEQITPDLLQQLAGKP